MKLRTAFAAFLAFAISATSNSVAQSVTPRSPKVGEHIRVAYLVSDRTTTIDLTGPWEAFNDVSFDLPAQKDYRPFEQFTVAETRTPIHTSGGLLLIPNYTFEDAPAAQIVVVPASHEVTPKGEEWLRQRTKDSQVVMSVCTGAYWLLDAGLLDGKQYTTNHNAYDRFEKAFPKPHLVRGQRWVQSDKVIVTSAGLSAGIDLALHVAEEYFGRDAAIHAAKTMEYESTRWQK